MLLHIGDSPDPNSVWATGQSDVLVWAFGYPEALDELACGLDHACPVIPNASLHLLHDELSLGILGLDLLSAHEKGHFFGSCFQLSCHPRRLYVHFGLGFDRHNDLI